MFRKMTNALLAAVVALGFAISSAPQADAHGRGHGVGLGIAAGIIGLGVLGAATAHADYDRGPRYYSRYDEDYCYRGPRECRWVGRRCFENRYGDMVCRGGRHLCDRPVVCD
jgi:hypothetical protein